MSIKSIIVHVDSSPRSAERVKLASRLAVDHDAHLTGLAPIGWAGAVFPSGVLDPTAHPYAVDRATLREESKTALAEFERQARELGVAASEPRLVEEETGATLLKYGLCSDLIVVGQTRGAGASTKVRPDLPEYLALNSTAPVLVVPASGTFDRVGVKVAVAWNGSVEARRAIHSAIALLGKASQVTLVMINPEKINPESADPSGADMAAYLGRHCAHVDVLARSTTGDIDQAIVDAVAACGADCLVMGAYGRSRFSELLLGGATRTILEAMTVPVWMAH